MAKKRINLTLKVWRQDGPNASGKIETFEAKDIPEEASFLEMLDIVNMELERKGVRPIAFDHDCREGICGSCGMVVNGRPHGPKKLTTVCQLHMREYKDGDTIWLEPWLADAFPIEQDLIVDRRSFDRIMEAGGYVTVDAGSAPDANSIPVSKLIADEAFDSAACIGCGACVAACKNASAMLFVSAKVSHLSMLPQGQPERYKRVEAMVAQMDEEGFGACSNTGACSAECPKGISLSNIARLNRDYIAARFTPRQYEK